MGERIPCPAMVEDRVKHTVGDPQGLLSNETVCARTD
jgi:hypothetical protein